jgi:hypothetical protein
VGDAVTDESKVDHASFLRQFEVARESVKELAKTNPYLFPEFLRLLKAAGRVAEAKQELADAKKAWNKILNGEQ